MESAAGTAPGRIRESVGTAASAAGTASGETGESVGSAASGFSSGFINE